MDRHYVGVVAAETRRLARELGPPGAEPAGENRAIAKHEEREVSH